MRNILPKELKIKFIQTMSELDGFSYEDGNPFLIKIGIKQYFIFLKNISPAYFKGSPDVTRVQLPSSNHFSKILKLNIPFVILGYDIDNDTMVSWNPQKVKDRLNAKPNVSLYSRESLQANVNWEFKEGYLSNGEKIILFKRERLIALFEDLDNLFSISTKEVVDQKPTIENASDKLLEITEPNLLVQIKPLLKKNKVLEAVEICTKYYGNKYVNMAFKDWFKLVKELYKNL